VIYAIGKLVKGQDLSETEAAQAMELILSGDATPVQIAGFMIALRIKGETAEEIAGLARTARRHALPMAGRPDLLDTCGTGGDALGTFNISTLSAMVAAACGATVAKHGNRAASSRCGLADLLEELGVKVALEPDAVSRCLAECGIGFMFAPVFHPAFANAAGPRRELGIPTVFNFLGPLTNPARPRAQVVGVADGRMLPVIAGVLADRGTSAYVVRGEDGLDEITTTGPSTAYRTGSGETTEFRIDPAILGLQPAAAADLAGGDAATNAAAARAVLAGEAGPARDIVLLNAAAALTVAGLAVDLAEGLVRAAESVDSGAAAGVLTRWVETSSGA
jgi:anthranilate phosphoribosyltransferase